MDDLYRDIFILESSIKDRFIIYSPLNGMSFFANTKAVGIINNYLNGQGISSEYSKLCGNIQKISMMRKTIPEKRDFKNKNLYPVFLLSQKCNLACSYCYAQNARSQDILSKDKIKKIVEYFLVNFRNNVKKFSFIGGGEPTLTWDLFKWSVNYIQGAIQKQKLNIVLTTNATLLNEERVLWLKQNDIYVFVSFDILPEIQNKQRSFVDKNKYSFDVVDKNIKLLINNGFIPQIRSTITGANVFLQQKMVQFVIDNYPQIKAMNFEPVMDIQHNTAEFYESYLESFFEAERIGKLNGVTVYNPIIKRLDNTRTSYCPGEFCVTPTGKITACHRVSSDLDRGFDEFCYGEVNDIVQINEKRAENIFNAHNIDGSVCSTCFAKWNCAGICTQKRSLLSDKQLLIECNFIKKLLTKKIENILLGI
ncbi:Cys-rich peptide radical SAM maturase CcpM [Spirochaetia bacterium]|nr:Cys-rich peptide radical SAM maturase CcpM [Spirochaetia bacterium]